MRTKPRNVQNLLILYPDPTPENNLTYTEPGANTMHLKLSYNGIIIHVPVHVCRTHIIGSTLPAYSIVSNTASNAPNTRSNSQASNRAPFSVYNC